MSDCLYTLPNAIRVIQQPCLGDVCCCGFAIAAGTRDELPEEQGIAHFTEHMLFKGTTHRNGYHILNRMGAVGGEVNAYTTKEEIFLYSICLKKDYERALELMCDMLFHSTFPQNEIENEREVVLDEINVYEDSPSELIYDDFEKYIYSGHPFGCNILGDPKCLNAIKTADFERFIKRCLTTDRLTFFSLSPLAPPRVNRWVEKYLKDIPDTSSSSVLKKRTAPKASLGLKLDFAKNTHQAHVLYGNKAYTLYEDKRLVLFLLNNILGGVGMNSRLNNILRERNGLVYTVESSTNFYSDTGLFSIYFGSDIEDVDRCMAIIDRELRKLREQRLSVSQLQAAKKQISGQLAISVENKESQALSMGKSMMYYQNFEPLSQLLAKIDAVSAMDICEVANEIFDPSSMSCLIYR